MLLNCFHCLVMLLKSFLLHIQMTALKKNQAVNFWQLNKLNKSIMYKILTFTRQKILVQYKRKVSSIKETVNDLLKRHLSSCDSTGIQGCGTWDVDFISTGAITTQNLCMRHQYNNGSGLPPTDKNILQHKVDIRNIVV